MICLLMAAVVMLGSAVSPSPDPGGSGGSNPGNYHGAWWIVVAMVVVALIIGLGTFYLQRTHRIDLTPDNDVEAERRHHEELLREEERRQAEHRTPTDHSN